MKASEVDGAWYVDTAGGHIGDVVIEPECVGPLLEPPHIILRWSEPHADAHGTGFTTFLRCEAAWVHFTIRSYRYCLDRGKVTVEFETVMRDGEGNLVNPEPPETVPSETWTREGWLVL